jgi:hypothetical protein
VIGERIEQVSIGLYPTVPFLVILKMSPSHRARAYEGLISSPEIDLTVASRTPALLTPWFSLGK